MTFIKFNTTLNFFPLDILKCRVDIFFCSQLSKLMVHDDGDNHRQTRIWQVKGAKLDIFRFWWWNQIRKIEFISHWKQNSSFIKKKSRKISSTLPSAPRGLWLILFIVFLCFELRIFHCDINFFLPISSYHHRSSQGHFSPFFFVSQSSSTRFRHQFRHQTSNSTSVFDSNIFIRMILRHKRYDNLKRLEFSWLQMNFITSSPSSTATTKFVRFSSKWFRFIIFFFSLFLSQKFTNTKCHGRAIFVLLVLLISQNIYIASKLICFFSISWLLVACWSVCHRNFGDDSQLERERLRQVHAPGNNARHETRGKKNGNKSFVTFHFSSFLSLSTFSAFVNDKTSSEKAPREVLKNCKYNTYENWVGANRY